MDFKNIQIFKPYDEEQHFYLSNSVNKIIQLLNNSPVVDINTNECVGSILNSQYNKTDSTFYGDIYISDEYLQYQSFEIVKQEINYDDEIKNGKLCAIGIVTYIKEVKQN